jgi:hypothetical protein
VEIHSMAWRAVCSGMLGSLLWFGFANSQPDFDHVVGHPKDISFVENTEVHRISKLLRKQSLHEPVEGGRRHDHGPQPFRGGLPACQSSLETCQSDLTIADENLKTCQENLTIADENLKTCQENLTIADEDLKTCQENLTIADEDLKTCQENLTTCQEEAQKFPATGQVECWDNGGGKIDCAGTGHDGDMPSGAPLSYTDNGDGTVTDNNTRFMWEKLCDEDPPGETCPAVHDVDSTYTWAAAFGKIATLNAEPCFAGYCDWRLPNVKELMSIVNYQNSNPAVSPAFNDNCIPSCAVTVCSCILPTRFYWSSTSTAPQPQQPPTNAWGVGFFQGEVSGQPKTFFHQVRAVRGP